MITLCQRLVKVLIFLRQTIPNEVLLLVTNSSKKYPEYIKETLINAFPCAKIAARSAFLCDFLCILPEGIKETLI